MFKAIQQRATELAASMTVPEPVVIVELTELAKSTVETLYPEWAWHSPVVLGDHVVLIGGWGDEDAFAVWDCSGRVRIFTQEDCRGELPH